MYLLNNFIQQQDFETHVLNTIKIYEDVLKSINLQQFNSNIIDPIKLTFDKYVFNKTFEEIITLELQRQRDKTNTNAIGYFHQNIFKYIKNCEVPKTGFDIIFTDYNGSKIFVEMKNKHNTMNSSASQKTYMNMQNKLLQNKNNLCFLVEILAPKSRNIVWNCRVDKQLLSNENIRRVSIDKFYEIVTKILNAFYLLCKQIPITIENLIAKNIIRTQEKDTVISELKTKNANLLKALYLLAFKTYNGFENF